MHCAFQQGKLLNCLLFPFNQWIIVLDQNSTGTEETEEDEIQEEKKNSKVDVVVEDNQIAENVDSYFKNPALKQSKFHISKTKKLWNIFYKINWS